MSNPNEVAFISLVKKAITGSDTACIPDDADFARIYSIAKKHDLAHLIYKAADNKDLINDEKTAELLEKSYSYALFRQAKKEAAIDEIRSILDSNRIPYILLKGSALMRLYPEAWMRTSSDIDVLVMGKDFKRTISAFSGSGMKRMRQSEHDVSFDSKYRYHIELHNILIEHYRLPKASEVLKQVWDHAVPSANGGYEYDMTDEMLYFYHIAHMVKHFETGGCGVRMFIDLWLLDNKVEHDRANRAELLEKGNLLTFAEKTSRLAESWFSGSGKESGTEFLERFILGGGVFGTTEQRVYVQKKRADNRFKYYLLRIFPPYKKLCSAYPVLIKAPVLLPFAWIARWFKMLAPREREKALCEIYFERNADEEVENNIAGMMKELGLW
ncbi:MAG: nucleotidyltransferase family protein [Clostridiales bacterium]|nr:nucleotidyltransferase family protein [Clostridiales bacterium]